MSGKKKIEYTEAPSPLNMVEDPPTSTLIEYIRRGVPFAEFKGLLQAGPFNLKEWADLLHLSERTIYRYEAASKPFDPLQSDRIVEIQRLNLFGARVFGSYQAYRRWLDTPSLAMGGSIPMQLLDNQAGIVLVHDALGKIAHGIPV